MDLKRGNIIYRCYQKVLFNAYGQCEIQGRKGKMSDWKNLLELDCEGPICHAKKFAFHHKGTRQLQIKYESGVIKLIQKDHWEQLQKGIGEQL